MTVEPTYRGGGVQGCHFYRTRKWDRLLGLAEQMCCMQIKFRFRLFHPVFDGDIPS